MCGADGEGAHPGGDLGGRLEDEHVHLTWTSSLSLPSGTEGPSLRGRYCRVLRRKSHLSRACLEETVASLEISSGS